MDLEHSINSFIEIEKNNSSYVGRLDNIKMIEGGYKITLDKHYSHSSNQTSFEPITLEVKPNEIFLEKDFTRRWDEKSLSKILKDLEFKPNYKTPLKKKISTWIKNAPKEYLEGYVNAGKVHYPAFANSYVSLSYNLSAGWTENNTSIFIIALGLPFVTNIIKLIVDWKRQTAIYQATSSKIKH